LHQAVVKPKVSISGKCFINLTSEEVTQLNTSTREDGVANDVGGAVEVVASEEEEEAPAKVNKFVPAAAEPEPEPESVAESVAEPVAEPTDTTKKVKKRVVRRKE